IYVLYGTRWLDPDAEECSITGNLSQLPPDYVADCFYTEYLKMYARMDYWLAKLEIKTGRVVQKVAISGSIVQSDGVSQVDFAARDESDHPALLLDHGSVYVGFGAVAYIEGSHKYHYHGWVMRYQADTLASQDVFCTSCDPPTRPNPDA